MMLAFFLFYDKANGKQRFFSFGALEQHCDVITYDGKAWILFQMSNKGIEFRTLTVFQASSLLKNLILIPELISIIGVDVERKTVFPWRPFMVRSCNELSRFLSGVDVGFTLNPRQLLKKLIKYNGKRNFQVIYAWRRALWDSLVETTSQTIEPMT